MARLTAVGSAPRERRVLSALVALGVASFSLAPSSLFSQDTVPAGVRIGLRYDPGSRPGVFLTTVPGANGDSVRAMLARDFDFSDRLTPIAPEESEPPTGVLNYAIYAQQGALAVVQASVTPGGSLHVAVHDVAGKRVLGVMDYALPAPALGASWRMTVHMAADSAEAFITGQRGIAATRVMFAREGRLWTVDSDGANVRPIAGTEGAISPAWHPNGRQIAYDLMPNDGRHRIVVRDLGNGRTRAFAGRGNANFTPVFSPDGKKLLFASGEGGIDLYEVVLDEDGGARRLTHRAGSSNLSPSYSPDGRWIVFTSGLIGHPEVYIMGADGTGAELLTTSGFGDKLQRTDPAFSPDGRRVAFQSWIDSRFQLMIISVLDRTTRQLTSEGENSDPTWAPDGRHLAFLSTRSGAPQVWVLDTESFRTRQLTWGGSPRYPAWSPRLAP